MHSRQEAIEIGLKALVFMSRTPETLSSFLGASGLSAQDLRLQAGTEEFAESVLDFLLQSDEQTCSFAAFAGLRGTDIYKAQQVLAHARG